jgi:hypothetical protein
MAAPPQRPREQYLVERLNIITDNGVEVILPPRYTDVITAKLASGRTWSPAELQQAQTRLENALRQVEAPHPGTAAGLTITVGWGLSFFRNYLPASVWQAALPVDLALSKQSGTRQYAVLDAIRFPSDPADVVLEDNHVMFEFRSNSQAILQKTEQALFDNPSSSAYVGDLFDLTSKRMGFLGKGFDTPSVAKELALAAGVAGADHIPDRAQLMLGFTSTQRAALGPDIIPSFETLPGITDQFPNGYFAGGCAMHLSHLFEDIQLWYNSFDYAARVARMFSPHTPVPADPNTVTVPNGPGERSSIEQIKQDAANGVVGHNALLQQATRLPVDVVDNYGRFRSAGTPVPLREDFNTLDNPFAWSAQPEVDRWSPHANTPGMHFVVFVPASHRFHTARLAMDGILPDGTNLREAPYNITDAANGINGMMRATHRQNYLVPPRARRSFPLAERAAVEHSLYIPMAAR